MLEGTHYGETKTNQIVLGPASRAMLSADHPASPGIARTLYRPEPINVVAVRVTRFSSKKSRGGDDS